MWFLIARTPPQWPGRRLFAAADALLWPICWIAAVLQLSPHQGIVQGAVTVVSCAAAQRLYRAIWRNRRYRFTTWRWGRWAALLLALGGVLKLWLVFTSQRAWLQRLMSDRRHAAARGPSFTWAGNSLRATIP